MPYGPRISIYYGIELDAIEAAELVLDIYEDSQELDEVYFDDKTFRDFLESEDLNEIHDGLDAFSVTTFTMGDGEYDFVVLPHDHPGTGYFVGHKVAYLGDMAQNNYAMPSIDMDIPHERHVQQDLDKVATEPTFKYVAIGDHCGCC